MNKIVLISDIENDRIDSYISNHIDDISRNSVQKLIADGNIKVNNKLIKSNYRLKKNDEIVVIKPEPKILDVVAEDIDIKIVYEDNDVAIINKSQGIVVHPAPGHSSGTLVNGLMHHLENLSSINGILRPGIVHRLDKNTSGLMLVAKNDKSHNYLAECLKEHSIYRIYYALVEGRVKEDNGIINAPLGRSEKDRKKRAVTSKNSKEAVTNFWVVKKYDKYTLLKLKLETGRTHQIRVHMKYIGHPVVGDDVYGSKTNKFGLSGQLLHSKTLGFIHPSTKEYMEFDSELPSYFTKVLITIKE
ncbi:23S rRNA pseudouridine1911/1915/1917 synthase [Sedimentibacter acidaminivorans]|jgi:23S rRNA pseudouridine1911/1915/1917 synthase|uniref:Pseudouridine synthase n=1 Tax=Sedimentibacter acidaminivorans TaxID=913099 RepID=A0ABS4GB22_9FIRM|nr:RluA family pseudouridine synthase [Sedimentibacter acidaminivorans]MBP1924884.1 23S rRNA pseudouridine1911/1915/1917 synthase [Sedimentibacter acidaminivorans]